MKANAAGVPTHAPAQPWHRATRRQLAVAVLLFSTPAWQGSAEAGVLENIAKQLTRPDDVTPLMATVQLLDAVSTLKVVQALADTPATSKARFKARALLPGLAKRLRPVGPAVAVIVKELGTSEDQAFTQKFGGAAQTEGAADLVYQAVGQVITISGRTLSDQVLEPNSQLASQARQRILQLIEKVPQDLRKRAQSYRQSRNQQSDLFLDLDDAAVGNTIAATDSNTSSKR